MNCFLYKLLGAIALTLVVWVSTVPNLPAQSKSSFDPAAYVDRLDRNRDGALTRDELNPRAAKFLVRLGVDANAERIRVKNVRKLLEKQASSGEGQSSQGPQTRRSGDLKVPAFGEPTEEETIPSFGGASGDSVAIEYSDSTLEMTAMVLSRYDKNKDGFIDQTELQRARWGRPDPMESDLDGDGRLSRDELNRRYHIRQQEQGRQRQESQAGQRDSRSEGAGGGRSERQADKSQRSSNESTDRSSTTRASARSTTKDRSAYVKYSKSLIQRYDKDSDGRLSKAEWKSVRRPPAKADRNGDGYVDQDEYAVALMNAASPKVSGRDRTSSKSGSAANATAQSASDAKAPRGDMTKLDKNADSQIQMNEYASDWDGKKLDEFYAIDQNGDGVITVSEWSDR